MGLVFTLGVSLIFLFGVAEVRWFLLASIPLAIGVAALLYYWHKRKPTEEAELAEKGRLRS